MTSVNNAAQYESIPIITAFTVVIVVCSSAVLDSKVSRIMPEIRHMGRCANATMPCCAKTRTRFTALVPRSVMHTMWLRGGRPDETEFIGRPGSAALPPLELPSELRNAARKHDVSLVEAPLSSYSRRKEGRPQNGYDCLSGRGEAQLHKSGSKAHRSQGCFPQGVSETTCRREPRAYDCRRTPMAEAEKLERRKRNEEYDIAGKRIHVSGLPPHATSRDLEKLFVDLRCGQVDEAFVVKDRQTGASRGFGFVRFQEASAPERFLTSAQATSLYLNGVKLTVRRPSTTVAEERLEISQRAKALEQIQKRSREWERMSRMEETERWADMQLVHSGLMNMTEYITKHKHMDIEEDEVGVDIIVDANVTPRFLRKNQMLKTPTQTFDKFHLLVKDPNSEMAQLARRACPSIAKYRELRERIKARRSFSSAVNANAPMTGMSGLAAQAFVAEDAEEEKPVAEIDDADVAYKRKQVVSSLPGCKGKKHNKTAIREVRQSLPIAKMKKSILDALRMTQAGLRLPFELHARICSWASIQSNSMSMHHSHGKSKTRECMQ